MAEWTIAWVFHGGQRWKLVRGETGSLTVRSPLGDRFEAITTPGGAVLLTDEEGYQSVPAEVLANLTEALFEAPEFDKYAGAL